MILWHFDWRFFLFFSIFPFFFSIPNWVCWESIFPGWDEMRSKLTFNNLWLLWAFRKHTLLDFYFSLFFTSCIFLLLPSYTVWETHSYTEDWEIMQKVLLTKNFNSSIFLVFPVLHLIYICFQRLSCQYVFPPWLMALVGSAVTQ